MQACTASSISPMANNALATSCVLASGESAANWRRSFKAATLLPALPSSRAAVHRAVTGMFKSLTGRPQIAGDLLASAPVGCLANIHETLPSFLVALLTNKFDELIIEFAAPTRQ